MQKIFLIDGNNIIHRSFHAIKPLHTKNGEQTNAILGFFSTLLNLIEKEKPQYLAVAFDEKAPTFRHLEHEDYKATRIKAPDELYAQIPKVKEILQILQIPIFIKSGFEADDLLGTVAHQAAKKGVQALIITSDHDALQLVDDDRILVIFPHKGYREPLIFNEAKVQEKLGVNPNQIIDYKAICGDASDNLKGIHGIGPKGAQKLLQTYGTLENIFAHTAELSKIERAKIEHDTETALLCKRLVTIIKDVPLEFKLEDCVLGNFDEAKVKAVLAKYELFSIQRRIDRIAHLFQKKAGATQNAPFSTPIPATEQLQLF